MAKGMLAGSTDYSHQSLEDIKHDLREEISNIDYFTEIIDRNIEELVASGYWNTNVPNNFKGMIAYSLKHFRTAKTEFNDILSDIEYEIKEHHYTRLLRIGNVASEINIDIGKLWHQDYNLTFQDYGNEEFAKVETVYAITRDTAVNLLDISNLAVRLKDFIGKTNLKMKKNNNPWISGSFYLFMFVIIFALLAVLSNTVSWYLLPIVIIGGILIVGVIGALQLRNDTRLKDETFLQLMVETYKRLPLLKSK